MRRHGGPGMHGIGGMPLVSMGDSCPSGGTPAVTYNAIVGSFNIDTTKTVGQTQAISGLGFQPKVVLFWWGGSTASTDTVAGGTISYGFGAAISNTSRFCVFGISEDAQAASDTRRGEYSTDIVRAYTDTGTLDGVLDFSSMDADGFTVIVDDQFTQAYRISYLALGGTDLTNVYIGSKQMNGATGNYNVTGVGFQPDAVIMATDFHTALNALTTQGIVSLSWATSSSAQGVIATYEENGAATSNTSGYGYNGEVLSGVNSATGVIHRHVFVSFIADGFTLNRLENTDTCYFFYVALKGGQYLVGDLTTRTDGADISETVGFRPAVVLFASANRALSTQNAATDQSRLSIGAGTSATNRACAAISDEDNLADTETAYANYDSAVYAHVKDDAIEALMDLKSISSTGFTCVMDDTETAGCWVTYLAIGS